MAKLYGSIRGNRGVATRCGSDEMVACCQSYEGSVITRMWYPKEKKEPEITLELNDCSSCYGDSRFCGTYTELDEGLTLLKKLKESGEYEQLKERLLK